MEENNKIAEQIAGAWEDIEGEYIETCLRHNHRKNTSN